MSCQIRTLDNGETCLCDTQTDTIFGPLMADMDEAEAFMLYLDDHTTFKCDSLGELRVSSDPRDYPPYLLRYHYDTFIAARRAAMVDDVRAALTKCTI